MKEFEDWREKSGEEIMEDTFAFFEKTNHVCYFDMIDDVEKIYSTMFCDGDEIEDWSPVDAFMSAILSVSADNVFYSMACALGVDKTDLKIALGNLGFYDDADKNKMPPAIGFEALEKEIEKVKLENKSC